MSSFAKKISKTQPSWRLKLVSEQILKWINTVGDLMTNQELDLTMEPRLGKLNVELHYRGHLKITDPEIATIRRKAPVIVIINHFSHLEPGSCFQDRLLSNPFFRTRKESREKILKKLDGTC